MDCLFCKIIAGEIPAGKVFEDEFCLAFNDISPQAPTHILLIPKTHIDSLDASDSSHERLMGHMLSAARDIAKQEGLTNGWRLVVNTGEDGGQTVKHLHMHILGKRRLSWPPG